MRMLGSRVHSLCIDEMAAQKQHPEVRRRERKEDLTLSYLVAPNM